jgi:molecular chaperone GrpE
MAEEKKEKSAAEPLKEGTPGAAGRGETAAEDGARAPDPLCSGAAERPAAERGADKDADEKPAEAKKDEKPAEEKKPVEVDWKDRYARLLADFDNFKKRTARDREDTYLFAEMDILRDVLPTVDHLALALANAKDKDNEFVKGVQIVYDTLLKALKEHGAEPFDSVGEKLDPDKMEAIASLPSAEIEEGKVSNEAKKGWMLKEKVLRAAQVVVSSGKGA